MATHRTKLCLFAFIGILFVKGLGPNLDRYAVVQMLGPVSQIQDPALRKGRPILDADLRRLQERYGISVIYTD